MKLNPNVFLVGLHVHVFALAVVEFVVSVKEGPLGMPGAMAMSCGDVDDAGPTIDRHFLVQSRHDTVLLWYGR